MSLSVTPIFNSLLDQNTFLQIVLQLEIETTNGSVSDQHESGTNYIPTKTDDLYFLANITDTLGKQKHYLKNEKSILAFHPSVPTPPPNC